MFWLPIVDISRHQGAVNFATMRQRGVAGVILRATHGQTVDDAFDRYWKAALAAGYTVNDLAVYTFVNPKRGSAVACARKLVEAVALTAGHTRVGMMLDIESYTAQSPAPGETPVTGPLFAAYIRAMRAELERLSEGFVFGYTNRSFWNSFDPVTLKPIGPNDATLAAELDWLVPRYPVHSAAGYTSQPLPATPDKWDEWAFGVGPTGPRPPIGGKWLGWQFSADFNGQGPRYGCQSSNLDLNIVDPVAWHRWTHPRQTAPAPPPTPEAPDMILVSNAEPHTFTDGQTYAAGTVVWHLVNGELRHVTEIEFRALTAAGLKPTHRYSNAELSTFPRYGGEVVLSGTFTGSAR